MILSGVLPHSIALSGDGENQLSGVRMCSICWTVVHYLLLKCLRETGGSQCYKGWMAATFPSALTHTLS